MPKYQGLDDVDDFKTRSDFEQMLNGTWQEPATMTKEAMARISPAMGGIMNRLSKVPIAKKVGYSPRKS